MDDVKFTNGKAALIALACYLVFVIYLETNNPSSDSNIVFALGATAAIALISAIPLGIAWLSKSSYKRLIFSSCMLMLSLFSIAGMSGFDLTGKPESFEQCMLQKMKGQPRSMQGFAATECRRIMAK